MADTPDPFARKRRILVHLAQSRRARESSRFDDKHVAAQARIQRRLEAQRQHAVANQTGSPHTAGFVEAHRKAESVSADKTFPEAEDPGGPTASEPGSDSPAVRRLHDSLKQPNPHATAGRRSPGIQNSPTTFTGPEQGEIARLQAKAQAEMQRAELVIALLEDVLSASTSRIVKQQARLEAIQAQINSLHGR